MASELAFGHREVHGWISQRSGLVWVEDFCGIAQKGQDGQIITAVGYDHHQDKSCMFHLATDRSLSRELLWRAFQVPFEQWGYNVLIGIIQSSNAASLNIAARLGFKTFATLPGAHPSGSLEFFAMRREECPWLSIKRKTHERWRRSTQST
jgi:L-amino acid N-acyltransferase YncA